MKKILFILFVLVVFLTSCEKFEVLSPINEEVTVVLLNVYVTFDYEIPQIINLNENFGRAHVVVSRRTKSWCEYTEIINRHVPGRTQTTEEAYFKTDDKIRLYVKVGNLDEDDLERYTYFQLGKKALGAKIFPEDIGKDFEIIEINPEEGLIVIEFSLD